MSCLQCLGHLVDDAHGWRRTSGPVGQHVLQIVTPD